VQKGGPADRAGVQPGDVIVRFGEHAIEQPEDLGGATLELDPGTRVPLEIVRDGKRRTVEVALGTRPALRRPAVAQ
jgi:serine protease Do